MSFWDTLKFWGKTPEQKNAEEEVRHNKVLSQLEEDKKRENAMYAENVAKINKVDAIAPTQTNGLTKPPSQTQSNGSGVATTTSNGTGQIAPATTTTTTTAPASAVGGRKSKRSRRIKRKNTKRKR